MHRTAWTALRPNIDHVRLARLLRRAHAVAIDTGHAPRMVREVVSDSWRCSIEAGVDPARPAARMLDAHHTAERLTAHPVSRILPQISEVLKETMVESGCFAAFCDADGVLLWSEGSTRALRSATAPRFLPGFRCSEDQIGTNALGTALVLDQPVQIFSAEHFNELLHGWTCAAAPVHDPFSGEQLGAIDLSGDFRAAHAHSVALVAAVARAAEGWLAVERHRADERLLRRYRERFGPGPRRFSALVAASGRVVLAEPHAWLGHRVEVVPGSDRWPQADGIELQVQPLDDGFVVWREDRPRPRRPRIAVAVLGRDRASVAIAGRGQELHLRHSEIIALLALNPAGMTTRGLAHALYGTGERGATVRAEIVRLRRLLGDVVLSRPYRLDAGIQVDVRMVRQSLAEGDIAGAVRRYAGPLLPESGAPGIVEARDRLARDLGRPLGRVWRR